ncbi:MAG: DUF1611 domain-containing protein [Chitinivibrionia bacterium]|nr:DUF1611 domain-containing protein [Chitinivibrionia bacterium]
MDQSGQPAIMHAPFPIAGRKVVLLAEGCFSPLGSKTAACFLRYRQEQVAAVLDSTHAGMRASDALVNYEGRDADLVFVEGQGSILHPRYAGVAAGLMFGVMPDRIIMCHEAGRTTVRGCDVDIPPMNKVIALHEGLLEPAKRVRVSGIALNTMHLGERDALRAIADLERETGLPAADPVRFGCERLIDVLANPASGRGDRS